MLKSNIRLVLGLALASAAWPSQVMAQGASNDLMSLGTGALRGEIQMRYDAALGLTRETGVVSADNPRFLWASQAKAQCGIALGFLKSNTRDPISIRKCADAYQRMQIQPPPPSPPPSPVAAVRPDACNQAVAALIFFDFDSAIPPESAMQTIDGTVENARTCGWTNLVLTGHTDKSGSDAYNNALSVRRANAIADLLEKRGISRSVLNVSGHGESEPRVPTADGERNPQNRRVEITVK